MAGGSARFGFIQFIVDCHGGFWPEFSQRKESSDECTMPGYGSVVGNHRIVAQ